MTQDQRETPSNSALRIFDSSVTDTVTFRNHLVAGFFDRSMIREGATRREPWIEPVRDIGQHSELAWLEANKHTLTEHENKWIAVSKGDVVASDSAFAGVRAALDQKGIADALITYVTSGVGKRGIFID